MGTTLETTVDALKSGAVGWWGGLGRGSISVWHHVACGMPLQLHKHFYIALMYLSTPRGCRRLIVFVVFF